MHRICSTRSGSAAYASPTSHGCEPTDEGVDAMAARDEEVAMLVKNAEYYFAAAQSTGTIGLVKPRGDQVVLPQLLYCGSWWV